MTTPCSSARALARAEVVERRSPAPGHAVLRLRPDAPIPARAGQFAMMRVPREPRAFLSRPMSMMGAGEVVEILVKEVGAGTRALARLVPGERVDILAPLGRAFPGPSPGITDVLVGGGVGAAPLLMYAREEARAGRQVTFLYGGRTAADLVIAREAASVSRLVTVTEDGSSGIAGIATGPLGGVLAGAGRARVLACGPLRMMEAAARAARGAGAGCVVCLEALMACGFGACLGCAVPAAAGGHLHACSDGPAVDADLVDWERLLGETR